MYVREMDSTGSRLGSMVVSCKHGKEPSGYIKGREFLYQLSNYQILNEDSAP
jgi:hypothetical protein